MLNFPAPVADTLHPVAAESKSQDNLEALGGNHPLFGICRHISVGGSYS